MPIKQDLYLGLLLPHNALSSRHNDRMQTMQTLTPYDVNLNSTYYERGGAPFLFNLLPETPRDYQREEKSQ